MFNLLFDPFGAVGRRWGSDLRTGIDLEFLKQHFYRFFNGGIIPFGEFFRTVDHFNVGIHADSLNDPFAGLVIDAEAGDGDITAIHQTCIPRDTYQPAPGAGSYQLAFACLPKEVVHKYGRHCYRGNRIRNC